MSKRTKKPAQLDLVSIVASLDAAWRDIRHECERLGQAMDRIEDAKRKITEYALAVAPVVTEESEE